MKVHNQYRKRHKDTSKLKLDDDVIATAQKIADKGKFEHSKPEDRNYYGENLAWNSQSDKKSAVAQENLARTLTTTL